MNFRRSLFGVILLAVPSVAQLQTGSLPLTWITGNGNCMEEPEWRIHEYNEDLYILRQAGCTHYEKPFLYLIFGTKKALLLDTGAGKQPGTARVIARLMERRAADRGPVELIAAHSHGHRDHTAGDAELAQMATVIPASVPALKTAFTIEHWPEAIGSIDLGSRQLDVIPIPGHDDVSIAIYDRKTGLLLTGDSLYPGRLYVSNWETYKQSVKRLVEWTRSRPVTHVLGAHIEQTRTPFRDYAVGTTFQPAEHALELSRGQLLELHESLAAKLEPAPVALRDFTITPRGPRASPFVKPDFQVPTSHVTSKFKLVPLGPDLVQHDYDAYMSSIDHLRATFSSSGNWPSKNITMADALKDVEGEIARFHARASFTYAVLTLDGTRELGCVYIRPSRKQGYDAQVIFWVTADQFERGVEPDLMDEVKRWLKAKWPFERVAFPKRDISQNEWDSLPDK